MKTHASAATVLLANLALGTTAVAGVVFEIEVTDHGATEAETMNTVVDGKNLKMEINDTGRGSETEMIYRGERREMVIVDHDNKSYMVIDEARIKQLGGQVSAAMSQMQEALKNVPADQRAMVEQMMKQRMPQQVPNAPTMELVKRGDKEKKNGYPCVRYEVLRDGKPVRELWVTDWDNVKGGTEAMEAFRDMSEFFQDMRNAFPSMGEGPGMDDNMFSFMNDIGGFPVVTREYDSNGNPIANSALISSQKRDIDADAFEPPAGYKRQQM